MPRFIQDKAEAYWFYSVVAQGYDGWINPLFWTENMREQALSIAQLAPGQDVVDVGAGTGFTTTGIVARADAGRVVMVDQSPHQLAKARRKPQLAAVEQRLGDAEDLPLRPDSVDRYVSAGSIEYWPDPQRAICEAYRVLRPGGVATVVGPCRRTNRLARLLTDTWMLFPEVEEYRRWYEAAGFADIEVVEVAPPWWRAGWDVYGVSIAGRKPTAGPSPLAAQLGPLPTPEPRSAVFAPLRLARFVVGSLAGAAVIPVALAYTLADRVRTRREGRGAS
jgi:MPBQ/MSBQ methyltransferase